MSWVESVGEDRERQSKNNWERGIVTVSGEDGSEHVNMLNSHEGS